MYFSGVIDSMLYISSLDIPRPPLDKQDEILKKLKEIKNLEEENKKTLETIELRQLMRF